MAWTSPRTWCNGEPVTAHLLNTHVRDNLADLNGRLARLEYQGEQHGDTFAGGCHGDSYQGEALVAHPVAEATVTVALVGAAAAAVQSKKPVTRRGLLFPWRKEEEE